MFTIDTPAYKEATKQARLLDVFRRPPQQMDSRQTPEEVHFEMSQIKNKINSLTTQANIAKNEGNNQRFTELNQQIMQLRQEVHDLLAQLPIATRR